jgi:hypothetical protein
LRTLADSDQDKDLQSHNEVLLDVKTKEELENAELNVIADSRSGQESVDVDINDL